MVFFPGGDVEIGETAGEGSDCPPGSTETESRLNESDFEL